MQQHFDIETDNTAELAVQQQDRDRIREEYRARLAEKLKDPEFRKIEGFPIGTDEAILALSDPPYYTACPNPFIEEWLAENAKPYDPTTDNYHREPFAADVSEGKNDPIYNAHSYHTKVPHKAIMRYILHYTEPGDVVYDGFCGTGMTGVAAQMCGDKAQVESLGYIVDEAGNIWEQEAWQAAEKASKQKTRKPESQKGENQREEKVGGVEGEVGEAAVDAGAESVSGFLPFWLSASSGAARPFSKLGARKAILNDLSPAATFIAYNYNTPLDAAATEREAKRILMEVEEECGWMYSTLHGASPSETERISEAIHRCQTTDELRVLFKELQSSRSQLRDANSKMQIGRVNYLVWSDILVCPVCGSEIVYWDVAVDATNGVVHDVFACGTCRSQITKRQCERATNLTFDNGIQCTVTEVKQLPVLVAYTLGKKRYDKKPDEVDRVLYRTISSLPLTYAYPTTALPIKEMYHGSRLAPKGITHVHLFYTHGVQESRYRVN